MQRRHARAVRLPDHRALQEEIFDALGLARLGREDQRRITSIAIELHLLTMAITRFLSPPAACRWYHTVKGFVIVGRKS